MTSIQGTLVALRGVLLLLAVLAGVPGCGDDGPGGAGTDYDVEVWVTGEAERFGALQFTITHLGASGEFLGRGDKVDCTPLVEAISAANNMGERTVTVGFISVAGVRIPAPILRCGFRTTEALEPSSFETRVTDASDTSSRPLDPLPTVSISSVTER
ncbi:MAG: hypothetical protein ABR538_12875 [Candidatus Binatia bacterium]